MSQRCDLCGKEPIFGNAVSRLGKNATHRRIKGKSRRRWLPNIQKVRAMTENGTPTRMNVCTSCIKKGKVLRRAHA
jgi:large subunit ribosomal protein L28